jgi:hypothetical protein
VQQQELRPGVVLDGVQRDLRRGEGLVVVAVEGHPRPVGAVIDEAVGVEARDDLVREAGEQVGAGQHPGVGGVEVTGQVVDQHQGTALRRLADRRLAGEEGLGLGEQLDELLRSLRHGRNLLR